MSGPELQREARRWLRFGREDLEEAERLLGAPEAVPRHVCWFSQQAAEKALKAALVLEGIDFPFRHDLDALRKLLPSGWAVKQRVSELGRVDRVGGRGPLPGDWPEAKLEDARRAVTLARAVVESVVGDFRRRSVELEGA